MPIMKSYYPLGIFSIGEVIKKYEGIQRQGDEFVEITSTYSQGDIDIIKSILNSFGILYFLKDEFFNAARPFLQPVKVLVKKVRQRMQKNC